MVCVNTEGCMGMGHTLGARRSSPWRSKYVPKPGVPYVCMLGTNGILEVARVVSLAVGWASDEWACLEVMDE